MELSENHYDFDVFISHASEDKAAFAEPLAIRLREIGVKVWFDKFTLKVGDSLHDSVERGLSRSRFGVVIFSPNFLAKNWPRAELNGLFAREMDGHKVILPVWHNISSAEMKAAFPIQADKVALRSSEGVPAVAKALTEVIRPDLLEVETQRDLAFTSIASLINVAKEHHPGYDFTVHSGVTRAIQTAPGTIATVKSGLNQIDISISDPQLIQSRPKVAVKFSAEGAKKADELFRTGKAQTWNAGEFTEISGTIPMMPSVNAAALGTLSVGPALHHIPSRLVRLEAGLKEPVTFPIAEMRLTRAGTEEAEIIVQPKNSPLEVSFAFAVDGSQRVEAGFSWGFSGHSCSSCKKVIEMIDRLRGGETLRLIDLETDTPAIETPCLAEELGDDPFSAELRRIVLVAAKAESQFGVTLKFRPELSEEDTESILYLDCLLNQQVYGTNLATSFKLAKREAEIGDAERLLFAGEPIRLFLGVTNYPGFFPLFGAQVPTESWGLYTQQCVIEDPETVRRTFERAAIGEQVTCTVVGKSPTYVRWKKDYDSSLTFETEAQ